MSWSKPGNVRRTRVLVLAALVAMPPVAWAQPSPPAAAGGTTSTRIELAGGVGWLGGVALGDRDASLRPNSTSAEPFRLFASETRAEGTPSVHARVGVALGRRYQLEGQLSYTRPDRTTTVSADVEQARSLSAPEPVSEYLAEGGLAVWLPRASFAGVIPFVAGGAGYRRQLHEGRAFIEQGSVFYAGGGLRRALLSRSSGRFRAAGWRVDGRLYVLSSESSADDEMPLRPAVSASLFVGF